MCSVHKSDIWYDRLVLPQKEKERERGIKKKKKERKKVSR